MKNRKQVILERINMLIQAWEETGYENYRVEAMACLELLKYEKSHHGNGDLETKTN